MQEAQNSRKSFKDLISPAVLADMADIKEIAIILQRMRERGKWPSSTEKVIVDALNQLLGESINLIGIDPIGCYVSDAQ